MDTFSITNTIQEYGPILIILTFTGIPLLIGSFAFQKSISTTQDFFIYNRSMGTSLAFLTVYATWWSSFAFLGSTSYFYSVGSLYWVCLGWNVLFGILFMVFGTRISKYGKARNHKTPIDFLWDIYRSKFLNMFFIVIMIVSTIPYLQAQFFGGAIIIEITTGGTISWQISALIFYMIMIIYLWCGGLRAVAWTDIFYGILTFCGMLLGGFILISATNGVDATFETLIKEKSVLILLQNGTSGINTISMWVSMFFIMPIGELMSSQMWLRMYAIKEKSTFHIMPFLMSIATIAYLGSMLAGSAAAVLDPIDVTSSDYVLPLLLAEHAAPWLVAVIMCCAAAACLSTGNSEIHSVSALLTLNIYRPYIRPKATEKHLVFVAKICILAFSAIAYLGLIFTESADSIVGSVFIAFCGMAQLIVPVAGGLFWKRSTVIGAVSGVMAGIAFTLIFSIWKPTIFLLHPGMIGLFINMMLFILCGILLPEDRQIADRILRYKSGDFSDPTADERECTP